MSRSYICGFELGHLGEYNSSTGTVSVQSSVKRSGTYALLANPTESTGYVEFMPLQPGGVQPVTFSSYRIYIRIATLPSANVVIVANMADDGIGYMGYIWLNTTGTLKLQYLDLTDTSSLALSVDGQWHTLRVRHNPSGLYNTTYLDIDDTETLSVAQSFTGDLNRFRLGCISPSCTASIYFDDLVADNGYASIGASNDILLLPISDSSRGTWTAGAGGTTSLFEALNNIPPAGLATPTNTSQITNVDKTGNQDAVFNYLPYDAAGLGEIERTGYTSSKIFGTATVEKVAQTFYYTGTLTSIEVYVSTDGTVTDSVRLSIQSDSGGSPGGSLAYADVLGSTLSGTGSWISFAVNYACVGNTKYWLVMERTGSLDSTNRYVWHQETGTVSILDVNKDYYSGAWNPDSDRIYALKTHGTGTPTINAVQAIWSDGEQVATGTKAGDGWISANPTQSAGSGTFDYGDDLGALGDYASNWRTHVGPVTSSPTVTLGTSPTFTIRKTTATSRATDLCFAGIYVDYTPYVPSGVARSYGYIQGG